jgi:hypothetical protein
MRKNPPKTLTKAEKAIQAPQNVETMIPDLKELLEMLPASAWTTLSAR